MLTVTGFQAKNIAPKDDGKPSDPYLKIWVGKKTERGVVKGERQRKTLNPTWTDTFTFPYAKSHIFPKVLVKVRVLGRTRTKPHQFLGKANLSLSQLFHGSNPQKDGNFISESWHPLLPSPKHTGQKVSGEIQVRLSWAPPRGFVAPWLTKVDEKQPELGANQPKNAVQALQQHRLASKASAKFLRRANTFLSRSNLSASVATSTSDVAFELPILRCPFEVTQVSDTQQAAIAKATSDWLSESKIAPPETAPLIVKKMQTDWLATHFISDPSLPGVDLVSQYFTWICLLDDTLEKSDLENQQVFDMLDNFSRVLARAAMGRKIRNRVPENKLDAFKEACREFGMRLRSFNVTQWQLMDFAAATGDYLKSIAWENDGLSYENISVQKYISMRRTTIAAAPVIELLFIVEGIFIPLAIRASEMFRFLVARTLDLIAMVNDVLGFPRELDQTNPGNFVLVIRNRLHCSLQEAAAQALEYYNDALRAYIDAQQDIVKQEWSAEELEVLKTAIAILNRCVAAAHQWHYRSGRYGAAVQDDVLNSVVKSSQRAMVAAPSLPPTLPFSLTESQRLRREANSTHRIVIVGAGASAMSASYHLLQRGYKNITILEAEPRIGGKCKSDSLTHCDGRTITFEHGAFALFPSETLNILTARIGMWDRRPVQFRAFEAGETPLQARKLTDRPGFLNKATLQQSMDLLKLLGYIHSHESFNAPGFAHFPPETLKLSALELAHSKGIFSLDEEIRLLLASVGFSDVPEIPAAFFLKFASYVARFRGDLLEHNAVFLPRIGFGEIMQKIAREVLEPEGVKIHCGKQVVDVKPKPNQHGVSVVITADGHTFECDSLLVTAPLERAASTFLKNRMSAEAQELFSKIRCHNKLKFCVELESILPELEGAIILNTKSCTTSGFPGTTDLFYPLLENSGVYTVYSRDGAGLSDEALEARRKTMEKEFAGWGLKIKKFVTSAKWDHYLPHFSTADAPTAYKAIEAMQGADGIFFLGEVMNVAGVSTAMDFAANIVEKHF